MGNYGSRIITNSGSYDDDENAGLSVSGIGDFNGDGIEDFAVSARYGRSESEYGYDRTTGAVYVVFGTEDADLTIDLQDLDGTNGFKIEADTQVSDFSYYDSPFGYKVTGLGDVNGDGIADFGIVENRTEYGGYGYYGYYGRGGVKGVAYVVYGGQAVDGDRVKVTDLDGFRMDAAGEIVDLVALGDVDGDGVDDIGVLELADGGTVTRTSTYLYDANSNGYYDWDYDTNPNEYRNQTYYDHQLLDVTGYVVYGTGSDETRDDFDPIADSGDSEVIVSLPDLDSGAGQILDLGQVLGGGGFYGGESAVSAALIGIGGGEGGETFGAGFDGGVDINGDGFADIVTRNASTTVVDRYVINSPENGYSYDSGYYGSFVEGPLVTSGADGSQHQVYLGIYGEVGGAGLGNFSGNDAPEELAILGYAYDGDLEDIDLPQSYTPGVLVLNGRTDFFDASFSYFGTEEVLEGEGSFFYAGATRDGYVISYQILGVLGVGDMTGDGIDDMAILTERYHPDFGTHHGLYLVAGTEAARSGVFDLDQMVADGSAYLFTFENAWDYVFAAAGDVNGDGMADLIIGDEYPDDEGPSAVVIHGGPDAFEAADNADGSDDNVISDESLIVDIDTGLVPIEVNLDTTYLSATEGDTAVTEYVYTVSRTGDLSATVTVDWAVQPGSSYYYSDAAASDFPNGVLPSGTVTFAAGEATATFTVEVAGDLVDENHEDFEVVLSNPSTDNGAGIYIAQDTGLGVIFDNDDPVTFAIYNAAVTEGDPGDNQVMRFRVYRYGKTDVAATIDWTATVYSSTSISVEDEDFEGGLPQTGTLSFAAGVTTMYIDLPIAEDNVYEGTEYVSVNLSNAQAGGSQTQIADSYAYGYINEDDFPAQFSVNDVFVTETDADDVTMTFTVTRSGDTAVAATVDYRLYPNSATADDFASGFIDTGTGLPYQSTLSFAAGETTKTISLVVKGDNLTESTESIYVQLLNPTSTGVDAAQIIDTYGYGYIYDDDLSVDFRVNDASVTEGANGAGTTISFTVYRQGLTTVAATVDYALEGYFGSNSVDAADFVSGFPQSNTLSFAAGETSKTITAVIADDEDVEPTEYMQVVLSNPATVEGEEARILDANAIGYVYNDDVPVTFYAYDVTRAEGDSGDTNTVSVRVYRSGETGVAATLDYEISPFSASQPADDDDIVGSFNMAGTLSFAAGETFRDIEFDLQGDDVTELDEYIQILFTNPTAVGAPVQLNDASVFVTIQNDDVPVSFSVGYAAVTEGQSGDETPLTFTIYRDGEADVAATVDWTIRGYQPSPGVAAESPDFAGSLDFTGTASFAAGQTSATVTIQVVDDLVYEGTEYVEMILSNPTAVSHPQGAVITGGYALGTIYDDEIPVYFRAYGDSVTEGEPGETGTLTFIVQRSGDTGVEASVDWAVSTYYYSGATDADLDEPVPLPITGTASFAAGQTLAYVTIDVAGDDLYEGTEYLQFDLSNAVSGNANVLPVISGSRAYGYINDDDIPTYFRVYGSSVTEGDSAAQTRMLSFTVSRYGDVSAAATVDYAITGGTANAADFETGAWPTSGTLSFAAGQTSITVTLPIAEDTDIESDEYTYMTLSNPTSADATILAQITAGTASATISNDDFPAYISVYGTSVSEGDTSADDTALTFTLYRSGDTGSQVEVSYSLAGDGSAPVGSADLQTPLPQTGTVVFNAGETSKTIRIAIAEDEEIEQNERARLTLTGATVLAGDADATVSLVNTAATATIYNDDLPPSIQVYVNGSQWGTTVNEGNSGFTDVVVTFLRDGDLDGALKVNYQLATVAGSIFAADSQDIEGFLPANGLSVDFADGVASVSTVIRINGDGIIEANESFSLQVTGYDSAAGIDYQVQNPTKTITIRNDDGRPPIPEIPFDVDGDGVIEPGEFIRVEADIFGDPHITTLDGLGYDFQAVGEYVLVETVEGAANPFSVQVRFEPFPGSDLVSVTTRMAVEVKGRTVEVDAFSPDSPILVDGVAVDMAAAAFAGIDLDGDTGNANDIFVDEMGKIFIQLNPAGELLVVGMLEGALNVCVFLGDPAAGGNAGAVRGLMGNANQDLTDDFALRDGSAIPESEISYDDDGVPALTFDYIYGFGDYEGGGYKASWALAEGEALFSGDTPDFPEGFPAAPLKLENLPESVRNAAIAAAIAAGLDPDGNPVVFESAALDFALTGMGAFLGGATQLAATPESASEATETPDLAPTVNVTADATAITEGDDGVSEVTFTFYRLGNADAALSVDYAIGGAIDAEDLGDDTALTGTVSFAAGEDEATLTVLVKGDLATETDEALEVSITGTDSDGVLIGASQGTTVIETDDVGPEAQDDAIGGGAGETVLGNVLDDNGQGEDSDADGDALSVTRIIIGATEYDPADGAIDLGDGRVLTVDAGGDFSFETGDFYKSLGNGEVDSFVFAYEVSDSHGGTDTAIVTLAIAGTDADDDTGPDEVFTADDSRSMTFALTGGVDLIDVETAMSNGTRQRFTVTGFEAGVDMVSFAEDDVQTARVSGGNLLVYLEGDRDSLVFEGVASLDDLFRDIA